MRISTNHSVTLSLTLPVLAALFLTGGCNQQRYQPAEWRPAPRAKIAANGSYANADSASRSPDQFGDLTPWLNAPVPDGSRTNWSTLPTRGGTTLPRRGGTTLPWRSGSTLPMRSGTTLPMRGGTTLPMNNWSTLPNRNTPINGWSTTPTRGGTTLPNSR